jgi:hypothetical protein
MIPGHALKLIAAALVLAGLYLITFGHSWGPWLFERLESTEFGLWLQLIVPFLPMLFIGLGAALFVSHRQ